MIRSRIFRLAICLALALLAVGLGGLSVQRKVQAFQPLGFEAAARKGAFERDRGGSPRVGVEARGPDPARQRRRDRDPQPARPAPPGETGQRADGPARPSQLQQIRYRRPAVAFDFPFLILALIGAGYLGIGLFTMVRHGGRQSFLFYLWCLTSATLYLLNADAAGGPRLRRHQPVRQDRLHPAAGTDAPPVPGLPGAAARRRAVPAADPVPLPARRGAVRPAARPDAGARPVDLRRTQRGADRMPSTGSRWSTWPCWPWPPWRCSSGASAGAPAGSSTASSSGSPTASAAATCRSWSSTSCRTRSHLQVPMPLTSVAVVPLGLVPLTFAYAILRYKLWDIEVIVRDTISWTLTLLLGIIGFSLINLRSTAASPRSCRWRATSCRSSPAWRSPACWCRPARRSPRRSSGSTTATPSASAGRSRASAASCSTSATSAACAWRSSTASRTGSPWSGRTSTSPRGSRCSPSVRRRSCRTACRSTSWARSSGARDFRPLSGVAMPGEPLSLATRLFVAGYRYAFPLSVRGRGIGIVLAGYKAGPRRRSTARTRADPPPAQPGGAGDRERPARRPAPGAARGGAAAPALHRGDLRVVAGRHRGARRRAPAGLGQRRLRPARRPRPRGADRPRPGVERCRWSRCPLPARGRSR